MWKNYNMELFCNYVELQNFNRYSYRALTFISFILKKNCVRVLYFLMAVPNMSSYFRPNAKTQVEMSIYFIKKNFCKLY